MKKVLIIILFIICVLNPLYRLFSQERQVKVISKENRIALVIGNNNYVQGKLANAVNDSRAMRDFLEKLGFTVLYRENSSLRDMTSAVQEFGNELKKGGVGLFYFSGHGLQIKGQNFLLPINVNIKSEGDVPYECYPADRILSTLEVSGNQLNIIILDACRDNPFSRSFSRGFSRGLAQMQSGKGMLIAYATSPGDTASDGSGMKNGLFTYHLINSLKIPGLSLGKLFDITRENVFKASKENQLPWVSTSVIGDFIFNPGKIADSQTCISPYKPSLPQETKIDLSDIEAKAKLKEKEQKEWAKKQAEFKAAFEKVKELDVKLYLEAKDKVTAWERLLQGYSQDNPFTKDDDQWRSYIRERIQYWRERELPDHVRKIRSKAKRVYKNDKGFWEAEFDYDIVMTYIPPGEFKMGQTDIEKKWLIDLVGKNLYDKYYNHEKPLHKVYLDGYWIGKHEITVGQFKIFVHDTGFRTEAEKSGGAYVWTDKKREEKKDANWRNPYFEQTDYHPVVCVSWNDANAFCHWISRKTGLCFHLPTEAQWEKAARGRINTMYYWGRNPDRACYYANGADKSAKSRFNNWSIVDCDDGYIYTSPIGNFQSNAYDLFDIIGNVWEWCLDWSADNYYKNSTYRNPEGPSSGSYRVVRGGCWGSVSVGLRCAHRSDYTPAFSDCVLGFRLAMN